jgi:hypothetical protein
VKSTTPADREALIQAAKLLLWSLNNDDADNAATALEEIEDALRGEVKQ